MMTDITRQLQIGTATTNDVESNGIMIVLIVLWIIGAILLVCLILAGIQNYSKLKARENQSQTAFLI